MVIIRLILLGMFLAGALVFVAPVQAGLRPSRWPGHILIPVWFCRITCWLLGLRVIATGAPVPGPALMLANHVSWTDILTLGSTGAYCFLAKREVRGWPGLGLLARAQGAVFIDRGRLRQIPVVNRLLGERLKADETVVIFAEATTGDGSRLLRFNSAHTEAARLALGYKLSSIPVVPVTIAYTHRRGVPLGRSQRSRIAWYGDTDLFPHLWDLMACRDVECRIIFGQKLDFTADCDRKTITRQVEAEVAATFDSAVRGSIVLQNVSANVPSVTQSV